MPASAIAPAAEWIDQPDALAAWLAALPPGAVVGADTEFMRRHTFYPQLALLQLGCAGRHVLVDPTAFELGELLQRALGQPGAPIAVMHSASEDLEALAPWLPDGPHALFDSQIAAAFAGMGAGLSYRALVAELLDVELDKGETRSDWLQRPLTASQRDYAVLDVVHLTQAHALLQERLAARDRLSWHAEDCQRLKRRASARRGEDQPQRAFRSAAEWPPEWQARLRRLLLWRDRSARALDCPRPWLLEDALVLDLAERPPTEMRVLEERCRGQRALRAAQRSELLAQLTAPLDASELAATIAIPALPHGEAKKALGAMKQAVDALAAQLDLPAGLLCPRKALEDYVVTMQWPELLDGWRRQVLEARLAPLLPG